MEKINQALHKAKEAISHAAHATNGSASAEHNAAVSQAAMADSRATKLTLAGFELEGVSIAGQETCIIVPRAKVAFDIGRCPQRAVFQQTVLISHGHLDHIGGVPFHVTSRILGGLPPSKLVVHPHYEEGVRQYLKAVHVLQCESPMEYELLGLKAGEEVALPSGFIVRPFPTSHSVPSQGYLLYSQRKKLRADLQQLGQQEIKALRLSGQDVTETVEVPEIAFTGDTTAEFLDNPNVNPDVFKAKLLIMEMSFLDDTVSMDAARAKGHMHIADFVREAHKFQNEAILLIHFSSRHKRSEIVRLLDENLPPALKSRVTPLLNGFSD